MDDFDMLTLLEFFAEYPDYTTPALHAKWVQANPSKTFSLSWLFKMRAKFTTKRNVDARFQLSAKHREGRAALYDAIAGRDLSNVVWSDEKLFVLNFKTRASKVYTMSQVAYDEYFNSYNEPGKVTVMVWGAFSLQQGAAPLAVLSGKQNGPAYIQRLTMYEPFYRQHTAVGGQPPVFMQDNASYHKSEPTLEWLCPWLQSMGMNILSWPPRSPDFNPIEHTWAYCQRLVNAKASLIKSATQLKYAIAEAWNEATTPDKLEGYVRHSLNNMVDSMAVGGGMRY